MVHQPEQPPEQAPEEAAPAKQQVEILVNINAARLDPVEGPHDRDQDEDVHHREREQEERRNQRARDVADTFERVEPDLDCDRRRRDHGRQREHDRRMAEGEEEPDSDRLLSLLHQLAGHVVDGGNMVGIDRMAKAKAVGQEACAE